MPASARFLGVDYGHRRIGLALSDPTGLLARPWKTIPRQGRTSDVATVLAAEIATLAAEEDGLAGVIFGYPRRLSGESTQMTGEVTALVKAVISRVTVPVGVQDERLSSREAEGLLARRLKDWRDRKALLDAASAAVILQDFLDGRSGRSADADGLAGDHQS
jgi:putative Holliday junction resolvase